MSRNPDAVIVGAGYVGLTLALYMASKGLRIVAVDVDRERVASLQDGQSPIYESGIREALLKCLESGTLSFSSTLDTQAPAWILSHSYFPEDPSSYLEALGWIQDNGEDPPLILVRGSVPAGFIRSVILPALEKRMQGPLDEAFYLVSAPERSLSGRALEELGSLPQLLGGSEESVSRAASLFHRTGITCLDLPNLESAELAKVFTNFARFVQFNLTNLLGVLCHSYGITEDVMLRAITTDYPRVGFLAPPGPGIGGFCLPKDALVLQEALNFVNSGSEVFQSVMDFPHQTCELNLGIIRFHSESVEALVKPSHRVLALGVAFKGSPHTDDTRDSVGLAIVRHLIDRGKAIDVYDRTVSEEKLKALNLPLAVMPFDPNRYDAVLLLNNDPGYVEFLAQHPGDGHIAFYDPWRLVVAPGASTFQESFPWRSLAAAPD